MAKRKSAKKGKTEGTNGQVGSETDRIEYIPISEVTRRRYLNYAMSVITSRALPDVRDGLKPVQRRILYVMYQDLRLVANAKPRKCAKICGDTTGNYHPHGDASVYDALVRLAQDFNLRNPLINGQGNFGSIMGLPAAAARYTEARLTGIAEHLMNELRFQTVEMRPNYDGTRNEPVVLPARFPNLLVNGVHGIAVGMATNIPPHNLGEVIKACTHLIHNKNATVAQLMKHIKGPDFPMGGRIVTDKRSLTSVYKEGRGPIKIRGEWKPDTDRRSKGMNRLIVYSVPYGVETGSLLSEIGGIVEARKLPQLVDVADETDDKNGLKIVLEIKPDADPETVMAFLYKHTHLEQNFSVNLTCLVPDESDVLVPQRCDLKEMLQYFLDFRFVSVRRRFEYQLELLERRIHILQGFKIIFNGLDKALKLIRASNGKQDAAKKLMANFRLDEIQTMAILELQLYRISKLEINTIREELKEKQAEADRIRRILASKRRLWKVVENELVEIGKEFPEKRQTKLGSSDEITEFDPQAYIVRENTNVVVSREGWIKRVGRLKTKGETRELDKTRTREGDSVLAVAPGSTLDHVVFFSSDGVAYTLPIEQVPVSSGYGEPLSKHARLGDGVNLVAAITTDSRFTPEDKSTRRKPIPTPHLLIVTEKGQIMRVSFSTFRTASTKAGRKYCRLGKDDRVVYAALVEDAETMFIATNDARVLHCEIEEAALLSNPGKGVKGIRLEKDDFVIGALQLSRPSDCLRVINTNGKKMTFGQMKYGVTSRGGKGVKTSQRSGFAEILYPPIEVVDWDELGDYEE
ncbi:DNA topoisomerase (ATP-hydrolyzing) subunit A [Gimesia aquarii]|uniref:DNA topoisomerase (ATP-hydrolyzing) n=1 Tax=Gimesia aquarii TaxID=2527964 RepID=A0A517X3Q1_9PLAN|nr:DNA topoisomerase (ATP-hydrolyzing) [Gimesia aquarii]QDU12136.1 DNA gyrase subunit A [Gimesia aquarii]